MEERNTKQKKYIFWVGSYRYLGTIISETDTHWKVIDIKEGIIDIPKTAVRKEVNSYEFNK